MSRLQNWPALLTNFQSVMQTVTPPANDRLTIGSKSATLRLLHLITSNEFKKSYLNVEGNFLIAAMHIACMRELRLSNLDSYPDIPERLELLAP